MGKARIIVDARMVGATGHGIGNYVGDIAAALIERELPYELVFLLSPECPADSVLREYEHRTSSIPFLHPREIVLLAREVAALNPALFHSPSFSSLWRYPFPVALTVHDLNHLHFAGNFHRLYYRCLLLPALKKARAIASVSETAAAELDLWMRHHGLRRPVKIVPNSIRPMGGLSAGEVLAKHGLESRRYFLCLSNPKPHKNVDFLKAAYREARASSPGLPPLALSTPGISEEGVLHLGALPSDHIPALLSEARSFFFPSLYEGFGRPPVEAALAGTVPVASDIPVLREALSGVKEAIFLPPTSLKDWSEEFRTLHRKEPKTVSGESIEWIKKSYSLKVVGDQADAFYRRALSAKDGEDQ